MNEAFGVYVHFPFCAAKCPYCDFNSHVRQKVDETRWRDAVLRELSTVAGRLDPRDRVVSSVFFGGGTPSLMSGGSVAKIVERIAALFPIAPGAEITLEANPSSVEAARFRDYRAAGVNRVSLGVQALDDAALKALGRLHSKAEALAAFDVARRTFDRHSLDLIYARPGQSAAAWEAELREALALGPTHLSVYQLTFEEGTPFEMLRRAGKVRPLDDALAEEQFDLTQSMTAAAGLAAYEVSNHAKHGEEARHNLLYWRYGEYLGVGPGAHGRIFSGGGRLATATRKPPEGWAQAVEQSGDGLETAELLSGPEQGEEALLMGLRLSEGVSIARIETLLGRPLNAAALTDLSAMGLIVRANDMLRATTKGRFVLNRVIAELAADG
jgi:putative oxygen-independent coproporphyrinogen III oxidase